MTGPRGNHKPENDDDERGARATSRVPRAARDTKDRNDARDTHALVVENLVVEFAARASLLGRPRATTRAVDGVSLRIETGRTLGLVGESGCGKSTLARAVLRLIEPASGRVVVFGDDIAALRGEALRRMRRDMQMVFQDPGGSLDPRMRVGAIVAEPLRVHGMSGGRDETRRRVAELLERCGLEAEAALRRPHEFSGGQRQRIAIARALATGPRLLVLDEPTAALDVSVQAQILNLLQDLQRDLGLTYLFISHDMAVVSHMCPEIAVMRGGRIVEAGPRERVLGAPREAYTKRLLESVPTPDPVKRAHAVGAAP